MKHAFGALLVLHGLIHVMGFAKAFGFTDPPQLSQAISKPFGVIWLLAAALMIAAAIALYALPDWWWSVAAAAVVVSQIAIVASWSDARYGTLANVIILIGLSYGFLSRGPLSFRTEFARDVNAGLARSIPMSLLTEADLAPLPDVVRRYIRMSGAVGQPRVQNFRAVMHGGIRSGPDAKWMPFTAEQYSFYDEPTRLFLMDATMFRLPVQAFHRFVGPSATMRVKVAALLSMVDAKGPQMDEAETITLFNDLCVFAPAMLVDRHIAWRVLDVRRAEATYALGRYTIRAELVFNERDELADFVADGRGALSSDGATLTKMRWSTPVGNYRAFGAHRLMSRGEGIWHAAAGPYSYVRLELDSIEYNVVKLRRDAAPSR
jgi:hypothetical protein